MADWQTAAVRHQLAATVPHKFKQAGKIAHTSVCTERGGLSFANFGHGQTLDMDKHWTKIGQNVSKPLPEKNWTNI